jgi:glycosyltransferase involved in cell wall biosynthesis
VISFSVLIITHGREELLLKCLDSLRPSFSEWQLILVANGLGLSEQVLQKAHSLTQDVEIIELGQKATPGKARNLALQSVHHEWVFLIDDDAYVYPNYFETVMPHLQNEKIDVLGGHDAPAKGMDSFSEALAITLASPFCTGTTYSRHTSRGTQLMPATEQTLTSCNLWIRTRCLKDIHFPEDYFRTEETSLLLDLERSGAKLYYHPRLIVGHHRRKDFKSLMHPTFYAGYYRARVMRDKAIGSGVFWLPAIFVLLHLSLIYNVEVFWFLARIYLSIIVLMSMNLASRYRRMGLFVHISALHYFIVFIYGAGFLAQRLGFRGNK